MACSAVLLKPNVANILLFNFCEQKFVQQGTITIAIDYKDLSLLIFEEKWPNYASELHQTVTRFGCVGFSMYACGLSVPQIFGKSKNLRSELQIAQASMDEIWHLIFCY